MAIEGSEREKGQIALASYCKGPSLTENGKTAISVGRERLRGGMRF